MSENKLWPQDARLFEYMKGNYVSDNERTFFEKLYQKQRFEPAFSAEQLLLEQDNEDALYFLRYYFDEYIVGNTTENPENDREVHVMNLSEALSINLKTEGLSESDISFFDWLRERDYKGVHYDRNLDLS